MGIFDFFKGGSKDKNDHITKTYHENGKLELEGNFKGGKKEGLFKVYHENGKLKLEGNYKDDKQEGLFKYYDENGKLKREGNYKDGELEGLWKTYHENGKLEQEGNYKDGEQEGLWKFYHENGKLKREGNYKDGEQEGLWKTYHENGKLEQEGNYKDGELEGLWKFYHENGELLAERKEINNDIVREINQDPEIEALKSNNSQLFKSIRSHNENTINVESINDAFLHANELQSDGDHPKAINVYTIVLNLIINSGDSAGTKIEENVFYEVCEETGEVNFIPIEGIYFNLGQSYIALKIYDKAKESFEQAIKTKSTEAIIHHQLGTTKTLLGDFSNCIADFDEALRLDPDHVNSYYMRSTAYAADLCEMQNTVKALSDVKKYLEYEPKDKSGIKLLEILKNSPIIIKNKL